MFNKQFADLRQSSLILFESMLWDSFITYQLRTGYARVIYMYISASKKMNPFNYNLVIIF
jgi:hypothetical protein